MTGKWMMVTVIVMCNQAWGQSKPLNLFAVSTLQVAKVFKNQGIQIVDDEIFLPANVVANVADPTLEIVSVRRIDDRRTGTQQSPRSWVKLACHESGTCLPFYAIVTLPELTGVSAAGLGSASANEVLSPALKPKSVITIRAGAHATLVMDDDRSHIQIAVVTLENGIVGHRIRVASPDHKQVYVAEVISAFLLKGSF